MAFISSAITPVRSANLSAARTCAISGARVARSAVRPARAAIRMDTYWEGHPASEVLGVGKDVPSALFIISSAVALVLGSYAVYMSNIFQPISAGSVNPQYIVGSLLVPISWGLYVFCFLCSLSSNVYI